MSLDYEGESAMRGYWWTLTEDCAEPSAATVGKELAEKCDAIAKDFGIPPLAMRLTVCKLIAENRKRPVTEDDAAVALWAMEHFAGVPA